jgi:hypothetical protein
VSAAHAPRYSCMRVLNTAPFPTDDGQKGDRWEDRLSHARHGADLVGSSADLVG